VYSYFFHKTKDNPKYINLVKDLVFSLTDTNEDGLVNNGDIDPFVARLTGG